MYETTNQYFCDWKKQKMKRSNNIVITTNTRIWLYAKMVTSKMVMIFNKKMCWNEQTHHIFLDMAPKQMFSECWKQHNLHELYFMKSHDSKTHLSYLIGLGYLSFWGQSWTNPCYTILRSPAQSMMINGDNNCHARAPKHWSNTQLETGSTRVRVFIPFIFLGRWRNTSCESPFSGVSSSFCFVIS